MAHGAIRVSSLSDRFLDNLRAHAASGSETSVSRLPDDLEEVIDPPAITTQEVATRHELEGTGITTRPTVADLESARTGVTEASLGVARYGSVVLPGGADGAELISLYPTHHVILLPASHIVDDLQATFDHLEETQGTDTRTSIMATGPSATADMGELVYGAHGPTEVHVLVVTDR